MAAMIVLSKLETLRRCLQRIKDKVPDNSDILLADYDLQDIVSVNLERAVQACVDIAAHLLARLDITPPATMAESFDKLHEAGVIDQQVFERMTKAVGFRNITVHEYEKIDWLIVYKIATEHLVDFENFARQVKRWADEKGE
jgi:uncharacterized protein YutE (UPF0331/DUF86 family)